MSDTKRSNRKIRAAVDHAIHHLEIIESELEPFDADKNREARERLEDALERLREDAPSATDSEQDEATSPSDDSEETIRVPCPECDHEGDLPVGWAGLEVECANCGEQFTVKSDRADGKDT